MKLSQLGELGLLADLERRGLIGGGEAHAAPAGGGRARTAPARLDISGGLAVGAGRPARRSGVRCAIDVARVPLGEGATVDDLGFGEDFELLAAVEDAGGLAVVGTVEAGEGVE